jgi:predicted DNA-binding transcriptional regulator AlpA
LEHDAVQLLTTTQIRELLPVSRSTIYILIRTQGFPPPVKILRRSLWRRDLVESWIRQQAGVVA